MAIEHHGPTWREATVVDVGAGTGLLSVMCGKFARKVPGESGGGSGWTLSYKKVAKTSIYRSILSLLMIIMIIQHPSSMMYYFIIHESMIHELSIIHHPWLITGHLNSSTR